MSNESTIENSNMILCKNLKALRRAKKMTQDELADAIGKSRRTIIGYENGSIDVSFKTMMKISSVLGCDICNLITRSTQEKIDFSEISIDTPILVRDNLKESWKRRYFAKCENGIVYAWNDGTTSWTAERAHSWTYAVLAEMENEI